MRWKIVSDIFLKMKEKQSGTNNIFYKVNIKGNNRFDVRGNNVYKN